jgi:hypothetical protein
MGALIRILIIAVIVLAGGAAAGYFILPPKAVRAETISVDRPAPAVFGYLANAPAGARLAPGVTQTKVLSASANRIVAAIAFADGAPGTATFVVTPKGDKSDVQMTIEQPLGPNPLDRVNALTGGKLVALGDAAAVQVTKDLNALPEGNPQGLAYELVQVEAKPFLYNENCSPQDSTEIKAAVSQSLEALHPLLATLGVRQDGPPIAVETKWDDANKQYCFQIGYSFAGAPHKSYAAKIGQTPAGPAIKVHYTGSEEQVLPTYDKMEALIAAARLTIGRSFEVYNDDPAQSTTGGSVDRDIYYLVTGDTAALSRVSPPAAATASAPPPSSAPAIAPPALSAASAAPAPAAAPAVNAAPIP